MERSLHGEPARFARGFQRVGEDTWAWLQPNGALGESNAGLVASGEHVLLVDTLWDLTLTRRMLDAARDLAAAAPETVFNTHSDGDHVWGNQVLAGARIVSTTRARETSCVNPPRVEAFASCRVWRGRRPLRPASSATEPAARRA
ncbi:MAG: MBL fold metallo-hydrolase, partial [Chloroflexota bacterium]